MKKQNPKRAVALKYEPAQDRAPRVIGKGRGTVAEKLLEVAARHNIPVYEDRELTHLLEALDLDREIPTELYRAVAEVMVFIYNLNKRASV